MRKILVAALAAAIAGTCGVASAGATIVYEKDGAVFVASNSGSGPRQLAPGRQPQISPDGMTVIYLGAGNKIFKIPAAGGASTQLAPDLSCADACSFEFTENSSSLFWRGSGIRRVPLDGSASTSIAGGGEYGESLSPDGSQIAFSTGSLDDLSGCEKVCEGEPFLAIRATAGGVARQIVEFGTDPIWTRRGIVYVDDVPLKGARSESRIYRVSSAGKSRKLLRRNSYNGARSLLHGTGDEAPYFRAGSDVLTAEFGRKRRVIYRLVSTASGRTLARRTFSDYRRIKTFSISGRTAYTIDGRGRLQAVTLETSKRRTLISTGVVDVNAGNTRF